MVLLTGGVIVWRTGLLGFGGGGQASATGPTGRPPGPFDSERPTESPTPSPSPSPTIEGGGPINPDFPNLTTFRGNATRTYYGEGPFPKNPTVRWTYPSSGGLCSVSDGGSGPKTWCGTGWTGQPNVIEKPNGSVEIRIGAYDAHYHFLAGRSGEPVRPDLVTGDLAKGSATSDPDGYPLYYAGSRDNQLRVVALDRPEPTELWSIDANTSVPDPTWNDDWDGAPLIIGDYLLEGGENSWFYVIKLNRGYDGAGKVTVDPTVVLTVPGYDDQLIQDLGDTDISIESSVAFFDGVAYFSNSGGLVQGWDLHDILRGGTEATRVFRYWVGDDVDATIAIDQQGYLYVARHKEHNVTSRVNPFAGSLGNLVKLDPRKRQKPVVWSAWIGSSSGGGDILGTPALYEGYVYIGSVDGELTAVNMKNGRKAWSETLPGPLNASPVVIDDRLLMGDCLGGLHLYDVSDPTASPRKLWTLQLEGCVESTPAVWKGWIWVGTRAGPIYGIADPGA